MVPIKLEPNNWDDWDEQQFETQQWDLYWVTADREAIRVVDMQTYHLFNAVRMLFNHNVPASCATGPFKRYTLQEYPPEQLRFTLVAMLQELGKRPDIAKFMYDELGHMASVVDDLLKGKHPQLRLKTKVKFDDL